MKPLDDITGIIVDASLHIHRHLGPGLLESVYEAVLARDLERRGLKVERQKIIRFEYEGMLFEEGLRVDLLVESQVVIELKSVENLAPVHGKQVLTYLRLMNQPVGLLINFGSSVLKDGLKRIVNDLPPSTSSRLRVNQPVSRGEHGDAEEKAETSLSTHPLNSNPSEPPRLRASA